MGTLFWKTVPTDKSAENFHRQLVSHAGRTKSKNRPVMRGRFYPKEPSGACVSKAPYWVSGVQANQKPIRPE
jgi:hypothetical protein